MFSHQNMASLDQKKKFWVGTLEVTEPGGFKEKLRPGMERETQETLLSP